MKIRSEPFLWIHLGGIIMFPLFFLITCVSLAVGDNYSYWLEISLLIAIAILPVLLMQLYRPFNIFSVLLFSLKPQALSENQRKILALFQRKQQKLIHAIAAVLMLCSLWLIYNLSPMLKEIANLLPQQHILGLIIASVAFFCSNLFLQIPLSALQVLLTQEHKLAEAELYTAEAIAENFVTPGIKLSKIPWLSSPSIKTDKID